MRIPPIRAYSKGGGNITSRIDKCLSDSGLYSRREAKELLRAGRVTVNGSVVTSPETKIDDTADFVAVDGLELRRGGMRYFMLNKPAGLLTATRDGSGVTVLDLFPDNLRSLGLFPVGRLDKDTTGLLLLTNDGDYAHRVISPKSNVWKLYRAETESPVNDEDAAAFLSGLTLRDGTVTLPARLIAQNDGSCLVYVREGKYHQVKRMLASRGKPVTSLCRLSVGGLVLDPKLAQGEYIELQNNAQSLVFELPAHFSPP